jgi:hypothetical protein
MEEVILILFRSHYSTTPLLHSPGPGCHCGARRC